MRARFRSAHNEQQAIYPRQTFAAKMMLLDPIKHIFAGGIRAAREQSQISHGWLARSKITGGQFAQNGISEISHATT